MHDFRPSRAAATAKPASGEARRRFHHSKRRNIVRKEATKRRHISRRLRRFVRANEAVSALEYAMVVGVIAVAVSAALVLFSDNITTALGQIGGKVAATKAGDTTELK